MKLLSLVPVVLGFFAGCTSEAASSAASAASSAASSATNVAATAAATAFDTVKNALTGITNLETAKSAVGTLTPLVTKVGDALKGLTGAWPASLTKAADGVREQVTRLSGMADVKGALGGVLDQITKLLPGK
jgi:phage-related protein